MKPEPDISEISNYYNAMLERLSKPNARHDRAMKSVRQLLKPDMKVLDLGCGTGITTRQIAPHVQKVIGIDLAEKLIHEAKTQNVHDNAEYKVSDICGLRIHDDFDLICLIDVIEHLRIKDIPFVMETICMNLKPSGLVYINTPDKRFIDYVKKTKPEVLQIVDEAISICGMIWLLEPHGFTPVHISIYGIDCPNQYNEYVFKRSKVVESEFRI